MAVQLQALLHQQVRLELLTLAAAEAEGLDTVLQAAQAAPALSF